jgi:hypothetical protein
MFRTDIMRQTPIPKTPATPTPNRVASRTYAALTAGYCAINASMAGVQNRCETADIMGIAARRATRAVPIQQRD